MTAVHNESAQSFMALPRAVLVEACKYLDPLSLMALARSCKGLRRTLLSSAVDHLWRTVRLNASPIDLKKPDDISEAGWTALLHDKRCHACGRLGLKLLWSIHMRLCEPCELICKTHHIELGGTAKSFQTLYPVASAFVRRASRAKLKERFTQEIRHVLRQRSAAESPGSGREAPAALVTELWSTFLRCYHPPKREAVRGTPGRFIPTADDLQAAMQTPGDGDERTLFWQLPILIRAVHLSRMFSAWIYYVEQGLQQLLPDPKTDDREAAMSLWRPVGRAEQYVHSPAWWPGVAHVYLAISQPKAGGEERRPVSAVLEYDARAAGVVRSLLYLFELDVHGTTARALDVAGAYVQCAACARAGEERDGLVLHWRHAVAHALRVHPQRADPLPWRRLQASHVSIATARDRRCQRNTPMWKCGVCAWASRVASTRDRIEAHLRQVHALEDSAVEEDEHIYAQPDKDSLLGLAPPVKLYDMVQQFATSAVNGSSQIILLDDDIDPLKDPGVADAYVFCLRCPLIKRVRHYSRSDAVQHLRNDHVLETQMLGRDYAFLSTSPAKSEQ